MSDDSYCGQGCAAMPQCSVCHRTKQPRGRDSRDNGLCGYDCPGFLQAPWSGHLWPEEWREIEAARALRLDSEEVEIDVPVDRNRANGEEPKP